jgi:hypothetical protein
MCVCIGTVKVYGAPNSVKGRQTYIKYCLDAVGLWSSSEEKGTFNGEENTP